MLSCSTVVVSCLTPLTPCFVTAPDLLAPVAGADCSSHPLLLTEPAVAPSGVRAQLAQLVFEAYGLPAMSLLAAAPAAFYHHYAAQQQQQQMWQQLGADGAPGVSLGLCSSSSGLMVCSGHSATYVVPVFKVRCPPQVAAATFSAQFCHCRANA
jgi:actin-related protein